MEKVLKIKSIKDDDNDYEYWLNKSYQERMDALEILRSQYIESLGENSKDVQQGLQRIYTVTKRKKG